MSNLDTAQAMKFEPRLIALLGASELEVKLAAMRALARIGTAECVPSLLKSTREV